MLVAFCCGESDDNCTTYCYRAFVSLIIFFIILFVLAFIVVFFFSIAISRPLFYHYNLWKREVINCSSPLFYTAFAYVTTQYIVIGLVVIGFISAFIIAVAVAIFFPSL